MTATFNGVTAIAPDAGEDLDKDPDKILDGILDRDHAGVEDRGPEREDARVPVRTGMLIAVEPAAEMVAGVRVVATLLKAAPVRQTDVVAPLAVRQRGDAMRGMTIHAEEARGGEMIADADRRLVPTRSAISEPAQRKGELPNVVVGPAISMLAVDRDAPERIAAQIGAVRLLAAVGVTLDALEVPTLDVAQRWDGLARAVVRQEAVLVLIAAEMLAPAPVAWVRRVADWVPAASADVVEAKRMVAKKLLPHNRLSRERINLPNQHLRRRPQTRFS